MLYLEYTFYSTIPPIYPSIHPYILGLSCYILNIPFILHMHSGYTGHGHEDDGACRLDLDDLGGEVVLIDWGQVHILKSRHVSLL